MDELNPSVIGEAIYSAIRECATTLRSDFLDATESAYAKAVSQDKGSRETAVLNDIIQNSRIAREGDVPICQDTGSVWVCLEIGDQCLMPGNILSEVDGAVARAYTEGHLRMSMVRDALFDRTNTNDNTPAFTEVHFTSGRGCRLHVMLKGGGSDNASRLIMLPPSAGIEGIREEILSCVREKAANACPPLLIGVGVGSTFDKVAGLAKMALIRRIGAPAQSERHARLEKDLLDSVNATMIGAGALGGVNTALALHIKTAPCHIAALPLAINMGCCAMRSASILLVDEEGRFVNRPL